VNEASQSELPWAAKVAERYHTQHTEKVVAPDLAGLAPRMVAAMEEPVDPFAVGVYLVSEITAQQVTVANIISVTIRMWLPCARRMEIAREERVGTGCHTLARD